MCEGVDGKGVWSTEHVAEVPRKGAATYNNSGTARNLAADPIPFSTTFFHSFFSLSFPIHEQRGKCKCLSRLPPPIVANDDYHHFHKMRTSSHKSEQSYEQEGE